MPKQILKIDQFHGGLNNSSDPRDISNHELSDAIDIMVDELGKISMMGGATVHKANVNEVGGWTGTLIAGYGLFYFSHDRVGGEDAGSSEAETGDNYLALYDGNDGQVWIYSEVADDAGGTGWDDDSGNAGNGVIDIGSSNTSTAQVNYYIVDGALRICDGNFSNSNTNQWYGYVDITHFSTLTPGGSADAYDNWHAAPAEVAAPTRGLVGVLYGTGDASGTDNLHDTDFFVAAWEDELNSGEYLAVNTTEHKSLGISDYNSVSDVTTAAASQWNGDVFVIYPDPGTGFNLRVPASSGSGATIPAGTYEFGSTFIYDAEPGEEGSQESAIYTMAGTGVISSLGQLWNLQVFATSPYDARIRGGRIYARIESADNEWQMIREISLKNGVRRNPSMDYQGWTYADSTNNDVTIHLYNAQACLKLESLTYNLNTGIDQNITTTTGTYKTAVVVNRMAYIGNVKYDGIVYGDAIFKSFVNKFDTFTSARRLEVSINDGDSVVKLETYADRLLIFKNNKLELLNISQEIEFLEDTFMHKGVSHPAATCKTDFGIAWVNKLGCYLYDGQKVMNLLEKAGRQIIKESEWATFTTNEPMIGYIPKKRQLVVVDDNTSTGTGKIFIYDMVTQSWIKGSDVSFISADLSNIITDWNGDLTFAYGSSGALVKWDLTAASSTGMVIITKDIDFGTPGVRKKVYKVYVTYKSGNNTTNVQVDYDVNGGTTFPYDFADGTNFASTELSAADGWQVAEFKPDTSSEANNVKSFRLRFATDGTVPADFEINDISIVYRLKNIK